MFFFTKILQSTVLLERSKIGTVYNIAIYIIMYIQNIQYTVDLLDVLRINYVCMYTMKI